MDWFRDLCEFHQTFDLHIGRDGPKPPPNEVKYLRLSLHSEEYGELTRAINTVDMPGIADGIVDLAYVILGTAVSYGIDIRPIWDAVHEANMAKVSGGKRADGKILKPAGWHPPPVAELLAKQTPGTMESKIAMCDAYRQASDAGYIGSEGGYRLHPDGMPDWRGEQAPE